MQENKKTTTVWVLIEEEHMIPKSVTAFTDLNAAKERLEDIKDDMINNEIDFKTGVEHIRNCECGIITEHTFCTVQSLEDAISPQGKVVWVISHTTFGGDLDFTWQRVFAKETDACSLFTELHNYYLEQIAPDITYEQSDKRLKVYKDDKLVVMVTGTPMLVGVPDEMNVVELKTI